MWISLEQNKKTTHKVDEEQLFKCENKIKQIESSKEMFENMYIKSVRRTIGWF